MLVTERQQSPYTLLALRIIESACTVIDCWVYERDLYLYVNNASRQRQLEVVESEAVLAYRWLLCRNPGRCGLSFGFLCDAVGLDYEIARQKIIDRWSGNKRFEELHLAAVGAKHVSHG